jgi:hypothetical protein
MNAKTASRRSQIRVRRQFLDDKTAYDRTTKYAQTKQIVKEGAYSGLLGAALVAYRRGRGCLPEEGQ